MTTSATTTSRADRVLRLRAALSALPPCLLRACSLWFRVVGVFSVWHKSPSLQELYQAGDVNPGLLPPGTFWHSEVLREQSSTHTDSR